MAAAVATVATVLCVLTLVRVDELGDRLRLKKHHPLGPDRRLPGDELSSESSKHFVTDFM